MICPAECHSQECVAFDRVRGSSSSQARASRQARRWTGVDLEVKVAFQSLVRGIMC